MVFEGHTAALSADFRISRFRSGRKPRKKEVVENSISNIFLGIKKQISLKVESKIYLPVGLQSLKMNLFFPINNKLILHLFLYSIGYDRHDINRSDRQATCN